MKEMFLLSLAFFASVYFIVDAVDTTTNDANGNDQGKADGTDALTDAGTKPKTVAASVSGDMTNGNDKHVDLKFTDPLRGDVQLRVDHIQREEVDEAGVTVHHQEGRAEMEHSKVKACGHATIIGKPNAEGKVCVTAHFQASVSGLQKMQSGKKDTMSCVMESATEDRSFKIHFHGKTEKNAKALLTAAACEQQPTGDLAAGITSTNYNFDKSTMKETTHQVSADHTDGTYTYDYGQRKEDIGNNDADDAGRQRSKTHEPSSEPARSRDISPVRAGSRSSSRSSVADRIASPGPVPEDSNGPIVAPEPDPSNNVGHDSDSDSDSTTRRGRTRSRSRSRSQSGSPKPALASDPAKEPSTNPLSRSNSIGSDRGRSKSPGRIPTATDAVANDNPDAVPDQTDNGNSDPSDGSDVARERSISPGPRRGLSPVTIPKSDGAILNRENSVSPKGSPSPRTRSPVGLRDGSKSPRERSTTPEGHRDRSASPVRGPIDADAGESNNPGSITDQNDGGKPETNPTPDRSVSPVRRSGSTGRRSVSPERRSVSPLTIPNNDDSNAILDRAGSLSPKADHDGKQSPRGRSRTPKGVRDGSKSPVARSPSANGARGGSKSPARDRPSTADEPIST